MYIVRGMTLSKQYDPSVIEDNWRELWAKKDLFAANPQDAGESFAITLPPPNVTGSLHMGHAMGSTLQDILIRVARMRGQNAMWMPGTDHAGIATQMLVERMLMRTEKTSRHDLGREKFLERVWEWKEKFGGRIGKQMRQIGFSLDWKRERFTMDESSSLAVRKVFVKLYKDGLMYRANRMVNWDPVSQTVVSDLEVNNVDESGHLWELKYPITGSDQCIVVATTRPETMLGDTGVAVHPEDDRYKNLIGKTIDLPLTGRKIPIVADSFVDPEFGSGAVKVTPAHDFNDFECGKRCNLETIAVIDKDAKMCAPSPTKYVGMTVEEARKSIVADMEAAGLLGEVKDYAVPRGRSDRSGAVIEPMLSDQWFVKADVLAKPAIEAVEKGETKFVPEHWTKTYNHWLKNINDWCVSRQLWWGHQIPAWYCNVCQHVTVSETDPDSCEGCESAEISQDSDVLDTWFSSALWPFSTLGWPEQTDSLAKYYPNSVLVTGPDIIFFWVARMMMMGLYFQKEVPFRAVYMTPIVTDENGDKMSKTKGNVIDPLDVIYGATLEELLTRAKENGVSDKAMAKTKKLFPNGFSATGVDALRFSLCALALPGKYIRLSMDRVEGYRNFINKLWNASRFVLMHLEGETDTIEIDESLIGLPERWILARLQQVSRESGEAVDSFRFSDLANGIYHFVWGDFCDWYIEAAKVTLFDDEATELQKRSVKGVLLMVLKQITSLMSPITPFVAEEIASKLPGYQGTCVMSGAWTAELSRYQDSKVVEDMELIKDVTSAIRSLRSQYQAPPSKVLSVTVVSSNQPMIDTLNLQRDVITKLAKVELSIAADHSDTSKQSARGVVNASLEVVVPLEGLVDFEAERIRLAKQITKAEKEVTKVSGKLSNEKFLQRAPADVVEAEKAKLAEENEKLAKLKESLAAIS